MTLVGDLAVLPEGIARKRPPPFALFIRDWKRGCLW